MQINEKLDTFIVELSECLIEEGTLAFQAFAAEVSQQISIKNANYLLSRLHNAPQTKNDYGLGLGQWLAICQFSIFELLLNFGQDAIPFLRSYAFGVYDWTQATAIVVLCRMAAKKAINTEIIHEINREMPEMRYETQYYVAQDLSIHLKTNPQLSEIIAILDNEDFLFCWKKFEDKNKSEN